MSGHPTPTMIAGADSPFGGVKQSGDGKGKDGPEGPVEACLVNQGHPPGVSAWWMLLASERLHNTFKRWRKIRHPPLIASA